MFRTGQVIRRPWYAATSQHNPYVPQIHEEDRSDFIHENTRLRKFTPDMMLQEAGAILCRVSTSFFRFAHLELFAKREEFSQLIALMDLVIYKEYPYLLDGSKYAYEKDNGINLGKKLITSFLFDVYM